MLKKEVGETTNRVSLGLKCGDCIHLERGPQRFEKLCSQLGQQPFSEACPEFTPDLMKVSLLKRVDLDDLAALSQRLSQSQTRLFAYAFRNADLVKKAGFEFLSEVVFSTGGDYLECYVRGRILAADRSGNLCYIYSDFEGLNGQEGNLAMLTLMRSSVMSMEQFKEHRKKLISKGRIEEPKREGSKRTTLQCLRMTPDERALYRKTLQTKPDEYVPPSIDTVPQSWLDNRVL